MGGFKRQDRSGTPLSIFISTRQLRLSLAPPMTANDGGDDDDDDCKDTIT